MVLRTLLRERALRVHPLAWITLTVGLTACKGCSSCARTSSSSDAGAPPDASASASATLPPSIPSAAASAGNVRPQLRVCFAEQIRRDPTTSTVNVAFTYDVGADGRVRGVAVTRRDGADDQTVACMTTAARDVVFEKPLDGQPATVNAPYNFHAVKGAPSGKPPFVTPFPPPSGGTAP